MSAINGKGGKKKRHSISELTHRKNRLKKSIIRLLFKNDDYFSNLWFFNKVLERSIGIMEERGGRIEERKCYEDCE